MVPEKGLCQGFKHNIFLTKQELEGENEEI
jgi:hypothetical protein